VEFHQAATRKQRNQPNLPKGLRLKLPGPIAVWFRSLSSNVCNEGDKEWQRRYTDEFRRDAAGIASTSGLTRPQAASDLGVGLSTLNRWVQKHQYDDLMSGPHEVVETENERLRKKVRLLREEGEVS